MAELAVDSPVAASAVARGARLPAQPLHIAIVGATGNVGRVMLRVLAERNVNAASVRVVASSRSAGAEVELPAQLGGATVVVEDLESFDPAGIDVALFSAGAQRSLDHAERFVRAGCTVIDNSSAWRMHPDVPLVVPEVNAHALEEHRGLIANPNCSTIQLVCALAPLHAIAPLSRVQVTTFQAVSGTGRDAMDELYAQSHALLHDPEAATVAAVYPHRIAFNVLPQCDAFDEHGNTKEELKLVNESRRIMELANLRVAATCVRVPVFNAHSEAVHLEFAAPLDVNAAREALDSAPGVRVVDDVAAGQYPMPINADGSDDVLVGRIRKDKSVEHGLSLFVVADNLRKGAATNAVQILEALR